MESRKPCPMCGCAESSLLRRVTFDGQPDTWHVQCDNSNCRCMTPDMPSLVAAEERWDTQPRREPYVDREALSQALRDHSNSLMDAADTNADETFRWTLRTTAELVAVLARVVEGNTLRKAFGAPGDWGYSSPIGAALAARPGQQ